jgi:hypothetical protein
LNINECNEVEGALNDFFTKLVDSGQMMSVDSTTSTSNSSNKIESSLDKFAQKLGFFKFLFGKILVTLLCL